MPNVPNKTHGGQRLPALAAGLTALLLAGPAAGPVAELAADPHLSFHDQFARSFTPETLPNECGTCTIKLPE
jgi:hypothetical protein